MADRALVRVGRDDRDVAHRLERLLERQQAARLDAVVVGDEDPRPARPLGDRPGRRPQGPRAAAARPRRRAARRAPCRGRAARSGPARGSCPGRSRAVGSSVSRRRPRLVGQLVAQRSAVDVDRAARAPARAAPGPAGPRARSSALGGAVGHGPVARRCAAGSGRRRPTATAATGMPKMAPGDARDARPDEHRAEDDDRVDADRALHDPRLEHVHDHEPAGDHDDRHRQQRAPARRQSDRGPAAPTTRTGRRTGSPSGRRRRPTTRAASGRPKTRLVTRAIAK